MPQVDCDLSAAISSFRHSTLSSHSDVGTPRLAVRSSRYSNRGVAHAHPRTTAAPCAQLLMPTQKGGTNADAPAAAAGRR
jgi:hypothetical protein